MNYLDAFIFIVLVVAAVNGFIKGFVAQLFSLLGIVCGVWLSLHYSGKMAHWLMSFTKMNIESLTLISFIFLFILTLLFAWFLGKIADKIIKLALLGWFNRLLGMVFSILKVAFILSVCFWLITKMDKNSKLIDKSNKEEAKLYKPITAISPLILPSLRQAD